MILAFEQLVDYRGRVTMVDGAFDPLHRGHIEYFRAAGAQVDCPLLCNVASDDYVRTKHPPLLPEDHRAAIVDAIRFISYTHINRFDTETILRQLRPKYYVKGKDWDGQLAARPDPHLLRPRHRHPLPRHHDRLVESHPRAVRAQAGHSMTITEFERAVLEQKPVGSGHYDSEYFTGNWRADGNNYNLETRRAIEEKNPLLIKDVFQPKQALDVGCGPGALMHLLWELGVDVDGIDFAESSRALATSQVRDRITVGRVTDPTLKPAGAYDLVICREVMEHLAVLQVKQTVANLAPDDVAVHLRHHAVPSEPGEPP